MRTRFLNTDYITSSPSSSIEPLTFLNLPVLPPPPSCNFKQEEHLLRFDPTSNLSPSIDRPPIDSALSKFIADVIPQFVEFKYSSAHESCRFSSPGSKIGAYEKEEERDTGFRSEGFKVIQFETPELDAFLENSCFCEDRMEILSEVPETEHGSAELRPGIQMQYPEKVQESIFSVEDITLDFDMDEKASASEDESVQENVCFQRNMFPLLEVDETSLVTLINPSMEDELFSFLGNIERQWTQEDNLLPIDGVELMGSTQFDILEFLLNCCLSEKPLEPELESLDTFQGIDMIFMVETLQTHEDSADCLLPMNPAVLEEFTFLDIDLSQHYELFFELQTADQPEPFDLMFREDKNFKNFDELIVVCELTLSDDTFKSLPIPIITDHAKVRSVYAIMDEKLSELKPQPLSASDRIYLDWHFLEDDKCNCKILFSSQNMLEELDSYSINFGWESFDDGKPVIDMILSDDALSRPQNEEHEELLNVTSETFKGPLVEVASSNYLSSKCPKPQHGEQSVEENAGKSSLLFKFMPQFNDLDFFLNPGKATAREKSESAVKAPDTSISFPKEGESRSLLGPEENMNSTKLEELLSFVPVEDKDNVRSSEGAHKVEAYSIPIRIPCAPSATKSVQSHGATMSLPDIVVIVNTQNFDKEMIVSRRSTYQRILAMEKEGAQVVERDLNMPVDVIISSSICLVWYDSENIRKKATSVDEASSCLPLCIENIATDVLTLLSLTFSGCILVFEGEISFLTTVMKSSDGLYAAAASLGIDLQLFCSYSSELTNEVILSSILCATKLCRGMYPTMPESETLAESFLTKFPSINPLTAHAILSSGGMLIEFLEWSHERRILAVEQYHVPAESVALFSALCKYGEREDSKSIMTDCSSSASSCPDSDKCHFHIDPGRKRQKCITSPQKIDMHVNEIWESEPLNQHTGGKAGPGVSKQYNDWRPADREILEELKQPSSSTKQRDGWMSTDPEMLDELKQPNSSFEDLFGQKQISGIAQVMGFPTAMKPFDSGNSKDPLTFDEMKHLSLPRNEKFLAQNWVSETNIKNELNLEWRNSKSENLNEDFIGEIIDFNDDPLSLGKDVASIAKKTCFSPWMPEMELDSTRKSRAARRLSFDMNGHPTFPTADEINSSSDLWTSMQDKRQSLPDNYGYRHINYNNDKVPVQPQRNLLEEVLMQRAAGNAKGFPFKEELSQCGGTPLSKAIRSSHPQPGSPWTIEFLNRIREKSRLRQQSLPRDTSTPDFRFSQSISKVTKTRSPSILEFFKYQGGSASRKVPRQEKQKRTVQSSNTTQKERTSVSLVPTWTPIDKRSKQTLSFAMDDSGSQTRLVWSDGGAHRLSKKFRRN